MAFGNAIGGTIQVFNSILYAWTWPILIGNRPKRTNPTNSQKMLKTSRK
jgi:hypothetical protein